MKKRIVRLLAFVMVCAIMLTLCACGDPVFKRSGVTKDGVTTWYLGGNNIFAGDVDVEKLFAQIPDTADPAAIYRSTQITEKILRGAYTLNNMEDDLKTVRKEIPFQSVEFTDDTLELSVLPIAVYLGKEHICCSGTNYSYSEYEAVADREVAVLTFAMSEKKCQVICAYEISGDTITFRQIRKTSAEGEALAYMLTGVEFSFDFDLTGPYLTFSKQGQSLQLKAFCMTENLDSELSISGYSLPDSPLIGNLDYFASDDAWNYAVRRDGSYYDTSAYKLTDDGRFTVYLQEKDVSGKEIDKFVGQYAYAIQSSGSSFFNDFTIVLMDGSKVYYYTDDVTMREARALEEQGIDVTEMEEEQIEAIAQKKADLFDDLQAAFEAQGITVSVNRSMGEIALDSSVLFGVDESLISDEGKAFLQKFMAAYTSVVFGEKYDNFVSKILVEGHTDTSGSYEHNMELSLARAESVKAYCVDAECGIDAADSAVLQGMMESVGYAYDKPVYDANGEVDMTASRRVSFRFVINTEQAG